MIEMPQQLWQATRRSIQPGKPHLFGCQTCLGLTGMRCLRLTSWWDWRNEPCNAARWNVELPDASTTPLAEAMQDSKTPQPTRNAVLTMGQLETNDAVELGLCCRI